MEARFRRRGAGATSVARDSSFGARSPLGRWMPVTEPALPGLVEILFPAPAHGAVREDPARRALNVLAAAVALVALLPLMLLIAALVKLTSPGPVLFKQPRVGMDRRHASFAPATGRRTTDGGGRIFHIYKFRTMYEGADRGKQVWATRNDPRVTAFGRLLRQTRLDELPQLVNVLLGDMNVVGPRPEQPQIFEQLSCEIPRWPERQRVRPGITGLAQIRHHYGCTVEDARRKLGYDLEYIGQCSAVEDLRIMAGTLPVVIGRRGGW